MNKVVKELLKGNSGDYIFPFFWQHGETEEMLRKMMKVIDEANCKSVCIESRPHPDFCGPKWWQDMDIILDEARNRNMKVWILDDSHFPTGFANGAVEKAPLELHRQSILTSFKQYDGKEREITINLTREFPPGLNLKNLGAFIMTRFVANSKIKYDDDQILSVTAIKDTGEVINLPFTNTGVVKWKKPEGNYKVYVTGLSRNYGIHKNYINMTSHDSCRILIDTVYETHWEHYKDDFGKTIAGFFSDEPELGNGLYQTGANRLGENVDLPFSPEVAEELEKTLGENWKNEIIYLWNNDFPKRAAHVRLAYMNVITKLVRKNFSEQIGSWCQEHGVQYIGHVIEDNNSHTRTGMSLGHYFRGLNGQHMSGIDDIGGQVLPQGEDLEVKTVFGKRDGEFYHFTLGNLGASAAAIEPHKQGNAMCEIFGNYGWFEGLRLEKYLAEHFMVRGINHFVPHAFTGKEFPDPDCPPHFYAQGHNPQYRHFGKLVEYMNRVCTLISNGHRDSKVAVLYNAEFEWMGESMEIQKPLRKLYEAQILCDTIPYDVFTEKDRYQTTITNTLHVNKQEYEVLVVPKTQFITKEMKEVFDSLPIPVLFVEKSPVLLDDPSSIQYKTVSLENLAQEVKKCLSSSITIQPASTYVRVLEYTNDTKVYYFFNESNYTYRGTVNLDLSNYFEYDAWANKVYACSGNELVLEPNKGRLFVEGKADGRSVSSRIEPKGEKQQLIHFERRVVFEMKYPNFSASTITTVPEDYGQVNPDFAGIIRYEKEIEVNDFKQVILEITDAYEGVEVFVNGKSLGIQIVPNFLYDLTSSLNTGKNQLAIEVATNLGREMMSDRNAKMRAAALGLQNKPSDPIGINGVVNLYISKD